METIGKILKSNTSILTKLLAQTRQSRELAELFTRIIEPNLAKHCQFAKIEDNTIYLTVNNAAWATQLRYAVPDLLKTLSTQPEFKNITRIRYTISNNAKLYGAHNRPKKPPSKVSQANTILWRTSIKMLKKRQLNHQTAHSAKQ